MMTFGHRFLVLYSGFLTLAFAGVLLMGATLVKNEKLDVLDVQRINVREPDGTLRAVISNNALLPGVIVKGKEYPFERGQAGMVFYNDEGTENGGLAFGGAEGISDGSLAFDAYEQDQIVTFFGSTQANRSVAGMSITDRPKRSIAKVVQEMPEIMALGEAERNKLLDERTGRGYYGQPRLFVGKQDDGSTAVDLKDNKGMSRLRLSVSAAGQARIEFLDAQGSVVKTVTADN